MKPIKIDSDEISFPNTLASVCKNTKRYGMYISIAIIKDFGYEEIKTSLFTNDDVLVEVIKAAPYLNTSNHWNILSQGEGILLFNSEKDMELAFNTTVGDDGPTKLNRYKGRCKVYALTCDKDGTYLNENT